MRNSLVLLTQSTLSPDAIQLEHNNYHTCRLILLIIPGVRTVARRINIAAEIREVADCYHDVF